MKRQVLISTTLLLIVSGGFVPGAIAATELLNGSVQTGRAENATPSPLKQNAERDRQRQRDAAQRERDRQRRSEMQERWEENRNDDRRDEGWRRDDDRDHWDDDDYSDRQERDRAEWERERDDRDWENRRDWEDRRWEDRRDWEFRNDWWRFHWQSTNPYLQTSTRLDLTSLSDDWVTVLIESIEGERELSFTGRNTQQSIYLAPGAYRIRFRPTLSSQSWRSGYLNVGQTESIRIVFDQDRDFVQVYDDPAAWVGE